MTDMTTRNSAKIAELTAERDSLLEEASYYEGHRPERAETLRQSAAGLTEEIAAWS